MINNISLNDLSNGALHEMFNREVDRVMENIKDMNTDPKKGREINIKVVIKPTEDRDVAGASMLVTSKLAPIKPMTTTFLIAEDGSGKVVAAEYQKQAKGQTFVDEYTGEIIDPVQSRSSGFNKVVNMNK